MEAGKHMEGEILCPVMNMEVHTPAWEIWSMGNPCEQGEAC
jgi:hypothetical protein